ncbi:SusC/RagA family TonB-linked outer membrane protein [Flammeovirga yaeyamensis]|uniref:SusC/RagA family TonB-linked outer membrane protein n=1 Tax=Flammeovirga yaeyamensis TaxID=367791 RepID=A0AAX1N5Q2_9BACT|nr:TonB-dependent receptor [Flammeovirga yaeyamensis]MBB3700725.1 TonB-linked SusC/RagA family outer membrane protein [Flammeovirga yaeyamensis]NMF37918.1 TonB-dependent receptor [Flammeovirga yaeyamensis]QWG01721.1 SusC/RagA family TonB-linked outer membrane protein [Flammeovirga yaeyamensis]
MNYKYQLGTSFRLLTKSFLLGIFFSLFSLQSFGQDQIIKGSVSDDVNPIPGANIKIQGTTIGTVTDFDGKFKISAKSGDVLVFSFVGYKDQIIEVTNQTSLDIVLQEDVRQMEEVVVIGYGTQNKKDVTGAVASVDSEALAIAVEPSAEMAMQGKVAGVTVSQSSGSPGSASTITIRGQGTIGDASPLYVVDGILTTNISFLNPNDIEKMDVLKDASATAIYGSRGANGVIIITTKKGKEGHMNVSFDAYAGVQQVANKIPLTNQYELAFLINEARINDGLPEKFSFDELQELKKSPGTNWQDEVFSKPSEASVQNYQFTASGGNAKSQYLMSLNYFDQKGIIAPSGYKRISGRLNVKSQVTDFLALGSNIVITNSSQEVIPQNNEYEDPIMHMLAMDPMAPVYAQENDEGKVYGASQISDQFTNPVGRLDLNNDNIGVDRYMANVFAELEPIKGLTFKSMFGFDRVYLERKVFNPKFDDANNLKLSRTSGNLFISQEKHFTYTWDNTVTFKRNWNNKHDLTVLGGFSLYNEYHEFFNGGKGGLSNQEYLRFLDAGVDQETDTAPRNFAQDAGIMSFLGRAMYSYDDRYLVTATFRRDGTSRLAEKNRWGTFPSFALAWKISNEGFMSGVDFVKDLKLRGGWGQVANDKMPNNLGFYPTISTVTNGLRYPSGTGAIMDGASLTTGPTTNLVWETSEQLNIGLDAAFLRNRLSTSVDLYQKKTLDMLFQADILGSSGFTQNPWSNGASVQNSGIELVLGWADETKSGFGYSITGNFSYNKNEVLSTGAKTPFYTAPFFGKDVLITQEGESIGSIYGYETDGVYQSDPTADDAVLNSSVSAGDLRYKDLDGDGKITPNDRKVLGNTIPVYTFGLTTNLSYKGFDLIIFLQGMGGHKIFNGIKYNLNAPNTNYMSLTMENRWTKPGSTNEHPRVTGTANNKLYSDYYVEDGDFLRLRNLQLGYTIPSTITNKIGVKRFRVYVAGQNLVTLTKYTGFDPEIGQNLSTAQSAIDFSIDRGNYPVPRVYTAGVNISF